MIDDGKSNYERDRAIEARLREIDRANYSWRVLAIVRFMRTTACRLGHEFGEPVLTSKHNGVGMRWSDRSEDRTVDLDFTDGRWHWTVCQHASTQNGRDIVSVEKGELSDMGYLDDLIRWVADAREVPQR